MQNKKLFVMVGRTLNERVLEEVKCKVIGLSKAANVVMLDPYKSDKLKKLFEGHNIRVEKIDIKNFKNWKQLESRNVEFIKQHNIRNFMVIGMDMFASAKRDNCGAIKNFYESYVDNPEYGMSFVMLRNQYAKFLLVKNMLDCRVKVIHFAIDPQEVNFCDIFGKNSVVECFNLRRPGFKFIPSNEYALLLNQASVSDQRSTSLLFYCGAQTEDRKWIVNAESKLKSIPGSDILVIQKGEKKKGVSQTEYYELLRKSKFTLVIASYDHTTFSIVRFMEALAAGCLPLVHCSCCLNDLANTYEDMYKVAKKYLIVKSIDDIKRKMEEYGEHERQCIINQLLDDFVLNKCRNVEVMQKVYKKILK